MLEKPVTAESVDAAGAVMESDFDAQTILTAVVDDTPFALTVAEDRVVGRISGGNIDDLTAGQLRTIGKLDGPLSPMVLSGGAISAGTTAGTFKVGALTALLRMADEEIGVLAYVTKAEEDNIVITDPVDTTYVVALNYNGGNPTISISESMPNLTQNIPVGKVMKNGSDEVHFISGGYMLYNGLARLHMRAKSLRVLELMSGSAIAYSGTNNFTMTIGVVYGGINKFDLATYNSASTTFTPVYRDGGSGFTEGAVRNTIDFVHYDDGDGTLGNVGVGRYGCHWIYRHAYDGHVYVVYGLDSYKLAEAEVALEPTKPDHLTDFGLLIGRIIAPQAGGSFTAIHMVTDRVFVGVSVATHNELGGLNDGDYKHLTATEKTLFDTVEENAAADQTGAEIKTAYEGEADTNAYDDAAVTKLAGIESEADVTDAVNVASSIHGVAGKATPVDADELGLIDSAASWVLKVLTWANVKATLKTYFDTLYDALGTAAGKISDTAYGAGWDGVTGIAPSKNATYDEMELRTKAAANLGDNKLIRGDGGAKGVQESTIVITDAGEMTNPSQPAFNAFLTNPILNITGDNTVYNITGAIWTEVFDQRNNFSNGTFTAPVTGRYLLSALIYMGGILNTHLFGVAMIVTSNRTYQLAFCPYYSAYGGTTLGIEITAVCDMDINDTAYITFGIGNAAKVVDLTIYTRFSGALIC
jgi:hypothetical protein